MITFFSLNRSPAEQAALERLHNDQRQTRLQAAAARLRADRPYDTNRSPADNEGADKRQDDQAMEAARSMEDFLPRPDEHGAMLYSTPEDFLHDSFEFEPVEDGIRQVTGELKESGERVPYAIYFDSADFSSDEAQDWLDEQGIDAAKFSPSTDSTYRQVTE